MMRTEEDLKAELRRAAGRFNDHFRNKNWKAAKEIYMSILAVCVYTDIDDAFQREMFGDRESETEGLMREEYVQKCFYMMCVK